MSARSCRRRRRRCSTPRNIRRARRWPTPRPPTSTISSAARPTSCCSPRIRSSSWRRASPPCATASKAIPGVTIVADITPNPVNKEGGFATMSTILQAHPDVDVVLGADTVVLGALAALEAAGKARPDQFLGGIDGEPEAVAEIKKAGQPLQGEHLALLAGLRLRHGAACRRLARRQEHPAGDGHPAERAHRATTSRSTRPISPIRRRSMPTRRAATPTSRCTATSATIRATST